MEDFVEVVVCSSHECFAEFGVEGVDAEVDPVESCGFEVFDCLVGEEGAVGLHADEDRFRKFFGFGDEVCEVGVGGWFSDGVDVDVEGLFEFGCFGDPLEEVVWFDGVVDGVELEVVGVGGAEGAL